MHNVIGPERGFRVYGETAPLFSNPDTSETEMPMNARTRFRLWGVLRQVSFAAIVVLTMSALAPFCSIHARGAGGASHGASAGAAGAGLAARTLAQRERGPAERAPARERGPAVRALA
jgi:hypothetical protein